MLLHILCALVCRYVVHFLYIFEQLYMILVNIFYLKITFNQSNNNLNETYQSNQNFNEANQNT